MSRMKQSFEHAVAILVERYPEYTEEAYEFMRTALDSAVERFCKNDKQPHLSARELYMGACAYALEEYGPLAADVLSFWGLNTSGDFGNVVYNLAGGGAVTVSVSGTSLTLTTTSGTVDVWACKLP